MNSSFPRHIAASKKAVERQLIEAKAELALIESLSDPLAGSVIDVLRECASALKKAEYKAYPKQLELIASKLEAHAAEAGRRLGKVPY